MIDDVKVENSAKEDQKVNENKNFYSNPLQDKMKVSVKEWNFILSKKL